MAFAAVPSGWGYRVSSTAGRMKKAALRRPFGRVRARLVQLRLDSPMRPRPYDGALVFGVKSENSQSKPAGIGEACNEKLLGVRRASGLFVCQGRS